MNNPPIQFYLASQSPRRRELLDQVGASYQIISPNIPEHVGEGESPEEYVIRVALEKARAGQAMLPAGHALPVLGADTAVVVDHHILGKPIDRVDGLTMLKRLSGRRHQVLTAMALVGDETITRLSVSHVTFRKLSDDELEAYWATGEPADKAGGYAIQGRAAAFIERLEGSYSGVMGLSLFDTVEMLAKAGIRVL